MPSKAGHPDTKSLSKLARVRDKFWYNLDGHIFFIS